MKKNKYRLLLTGFCLLFALGVPAAAAAETPDDIVVFVHQSSKINSVSAAELRQLFLKQKTSWSSGEAVVCINAPSGTPLRNQFRQQVLGMSEAEEATHWETVRIRNQITPPSEMLNTPKPVFRLKSAISYAFRKDVPAGVVKIILEIPK